MSRPRMSDTSPTPAADAAVKTTDGVTPPATVEPSAQTDKSEAKTALSAEQARDVLRGIDKPESAGRDPLEDRAERDPLDSIDGNDPLGEVTDEPPGDTPAEEAAPTEEAPAEQHEEEPQPPEEVPKAEETGRKRVNITRKNPDGSYVFPDRERAILHHAEEQGIGYEAAKRALYGDAPAAEVQPKAVESADAPPSIESLDARIAELEKQVDAADEAMDPPAARKAEREIKKLEQQKAQRQADQSREVNTHAARHETEVQASIDGARGLYPDAGKEGTPLYEAVQAEIAELSQSNPEFFRNARWPKMLTAMKAAELGIPPKSATAAAPVPTAPKPVVPPKKPARPAPSPAPGSSTAQTVDSPTFDTLSAELKSANTPAKYKAVKAKAIAAGYTL